MTTTQGHVFEATEANFEQDVINASMHTPVLVDFWAEWCGPCKTLGPLLEKLAAEYNGAFRLAKVDVENAQALAGMFGIRSIPTVVLIDKGQVADGFAGALPEGQLREFLGRFVQPKSLVEYDAPEPEPATETAHESAEHAIARLQQEIASAPDRAELRLDLALAKMRAGDIDAARTELEALPANLATDERAERLRGQLELAEPLAGAADAQALEQRIAEAPDDWEARDLLGIRLLLGEHPERGLEQFLYILEKRRDWRDELARKRLLAAFRVLDDEALVGRYRRRMASLLF